MNDLFFTYLSAQKRADKLISKIFITLNVGFRKKLFMCKVSSDDGRVLKYFKKEALFLSEI